MNQKKFIIIIVVMTLLIFGSGIWYLSKNNTKAVIAQNTLAKAVAQTTSYSWGEININKGLVETEFSIKNEGQDILQLYNPSTSCSCTTAQIITNENSSPISRMHTQSNYVSNVKPGESAKIKVVFDPLFHGPSGVGPISRQIIINTNDTNNPTINFTVSATVVK